MNRHPLIALPALAACFLVIVAATAYTGANHDKPGPSAAKARITPASSPSPKTIQDPRPNLLLIIADDWGWPHAGAYGDDAIHTPAFDRIAREGVLFTHAFVASPSCTPSRNALLTGQDIWRLGTGANLYGQLPAQLDVYPLLLQQAGFRIGHGGKSYGPGSLNNRDQHPAGPGFGPGINGFSRFLDEQPDDTPFCYWLGSSDPHRPYANNAGQDAGIDADQVHLFSHFPDTPAVRHDIADYYSEVQRFDRLVADALDQLEQRGLLDDTLIVVTGDHGMPFPRCKGNLYDAGVRVPLAIRFPGGIGQPGSTTDALVSLTDLAPTFLDAAGVTTPDDMTGRSLLPLLAATDDADVEWRNHIVFGRERHTSCQEAPTTGGYPSRAIRTDRWLYIQNLEPLRWPAGTPFPERALPLPHRNNIRGWLGDCDNGPTKFTIYTHRNTPGYEHHWQLCFAKRPTAELYDLHNDPDALHNLATFDGDPAYHEIAEELQAALTQYLLDTGDPRAEIVLSAPPERTVAPFDTDPYTGGVPTHPGQQTLDRYAPQP